MAKDWMAKVSKLAGALNDIRDVHATVVQTPSPSLNFLFGNGWGLPLGYSVVLYGPPKAGKSIITYAMAGQVHKDYPDGWVIKFNTEYREEGQLTPEMAQIYGIDWNRYKGIETNHPAEIYDQIADQIDAMCKDGFPLKLVIIDSMNAIQGRRTLDSDKQTVMTQQIGDVAFTNKEGLKRVLAVQRRHRFGLVMTSHVAVEMDPIEQKRGNKFKMGASIGVQHHAEYFMFVEPNKNKDGRQDLLGKDLADQTKKDMQERAEQLGHKIRVIMKDSSMGPKGRRAEFTFDYKHGFINTHEEIYLLGKNRNIIQKTSAHVYSVPGHPHPGVKGEDNFITWFRDDAQAQDLVVKELRRQDLAGLQAHFDAVDEKEWAANTVPEVKEATA
jgi:hypothetical protein